MEGLYSRRGFLKTATAGGRGAHMPGVQKHINSRIASGGGEMMAEAAIRLLKELG